METGPESGLIGTKLFLSNLATLPSGLKFRTLKLSWCIGDELQLLVDACAPTLECMQLTGRLFGVSFLPRGERPWLMQSNHQVLPDIPRSVSNVTPHSENLKSN